VTSSSASLDARCPTTFRKLRLEVSPSSPPKKCRGGKGGDQGLSEFLTRRSLAQIHSPLSQQSKPIPRTLRPARERVPRSSYGSNCQMLGNETSPRTLRRVPRVTPWLHFCRTTWKPKRLQRRDTSENGVSPRVAMPAGSVGVWRNPFDLFEYPSTNPY
jgi:hypothetical protein